MEPNVLVCYSFTTKGHSSGFGNISAYMPKINVQEIRGIERQIREMEDWLAVTVINVIKFSE